MRRWPLLIFTCLLILSSAAAYSQQFLLVQKTTGFKNFKYYPGDDIRIGITYEKRIVEGVITCITDSSICIGSWEEVMFEDVKAIYRKRYGIRFIRGFLLVAGAGYFALDTFNRLINNDAPVILAETAYIGAGLVAFNFLLIPVQYRRLKAGKWQLSNIDFNLYQLYPD